MAITRSQIAKQLLSNGGRIGFADGAYDDRKAKQSQASYSGAAKSGGTQEGPDMDRRSRYLSTQRYAKPESPTYYRDEAEKLRVERDKEALRNLIKQGVPRSNLPGVGGILLNVATPLRNKIFKKNIDRYKATTTGPYTLSGYQQYMQNFRDRFTPEGDGQDQPIIPIFPETMMAQDPSIMDQEAEGITGIAGIPGAEDEGLRLRFMAEGGMLDEDTGRQMYGLGKLVKKAFKTVKKVAKSPIGKAAILYTVTGGLGNLAAGTGLRGALSGFTSPTSFLAPSKLGGIFTGEGLKNIAFGQAAAGTKAMPGMGELFKPATSGILGFGGEFSPLKAISAVSLLPLLGIGTGEESEEEAEDLIRGAGLDINEIRSNPNKYLARRFRAEGGIMKEPVAKKTMPLLDMGGKEMDLRAEGGFVPIGRMEKADDVPARLSKNEFVFTADAVRNAGDGNVDKGAEVMYNMMKNLESGGDVSKESQGLKGARKMFQTSQRLEEVL